MMSTCNARLYEVYEQRSSNEMNGRVGSCFNCPRRCLANLSFRADLNHTACLVFVEIRNGIEGDS